MNQIDSFQNSNLGDFEALMPEIMIDAVEKAIGQQMTGLAIAMPSYINRVYEFQCVSGERLIAKFYRPGRWTYEALQDEHDFMLDCFNAEIPLVPPEILTCGKTIDSVQGIYFAVFKKKSGREFDIKEEGDWKRLGSIVGRIHLEGSRLTAENRIKLHPAQITQANVDLILDRNLIQEPYRSEFKSITSEIIHIIAPLFDDVEFIRVHGDCHRGNLLERPGEGIMVIDFDDMMNAPPVQDLWLLLPDHAEECKMELNLLLDGYEQFCDFDYFSLKLIEPLRVMRIIYFLSWCAKQIDDFQFEQHYPGWGTPAFWMRENNDLTTQLEIIKRTLS